jgi:hypothetical protein
MSEPRNKGTLPDIVSALVSRVDQLEASNQDVWIRVAKLSGMIALIVLALLAIGIRLV